MSKYLIRLDDACEYMDTERWGRMEKLLDQYSILPIVGIIPRCEDPSFVNQYPVDFDFWYKAQSWQFKGWTIAQHGYNHIYTTGEGGLNPVNMRSEFAGLPYEQQAEKIREGYQILLNNKLVPRMFFAPSHTFDSNTLIALIKETPVRVISDTIATDQYYAKQIHFIPQQSGKARAMPFNLTTFCYHPNEMTEKDFEDFRSFINMHKQNFINFQNLVLSSRKFNLFDLLLSKIYFTIKKIKRLLIALKSETKRCSK